MSWEDDGAGGIDQKFDRYSPVIGKRAADPDHLSGDEERRWM
jgi:hypothetical protein